MKANYIEEAIRCGFHEIAMTEHVPHNHTEDSWIPWEQFPEYDRALNRAVREYEGRIHVIKGFECEYYPDEMDDYRRFQEVYGYELLILGQHRCGKNKEVDILFDYNKRSLLNNSAKVWVIGKEKA